MFRAEMLGPIVLTAGLVGVQPACAQDSGLSATATLTSDYRFRGVSQSGLDPAVQASVDYAAASSGLYAGVWASSVEGQAGADAEVDLYAGINRTTASGLRWGIGGYGYFYPGGDHLSYGEATAELGYTLGPVQAKGMVAYAPSQANIGGDNLYLGGELNAGIPRTPFSVALRGGYEDGMYDGKLDWQAELRFVRAPFTLSASYVDTNLKRSDPFGRYGRAGAIMSVSVVF
jgi:uncharacterized protein (TIGR02001 family)